MKKVKRERHNWVVVLHKDNDPEKLKYFFDLFAKVRKGKCMSANRCAYYTLKHFYSTTTIAELWSKVYGLHKSTSGSSTL